MLNQYIDHTYLKPFAKKEDILRVCSEARQYQFASVCVNPCNVALVHEALAGSGVKTCSVIGFPFGTHTTAIKVAEAEGAIADGADEIDMVINVGRLLDGDEAYVQAEVAALVEACHSRGALLKVIIETCYLNEEQIAAMCRIVEDTGADFIKTSTGYGSRGAEPHDIELFKKYLKKPAKMKASGGIRTTKDAQMYVDMGCARLGTSNGVQIMEGAQGGEAY
ncbi:deoxyribose-phosphate aldolase [Gemmiger formicilis]|uniref:deoxyribose-phosphate aldolase n=1 Tax=Gemmiger formicilis TaxID=745368 RepID=UPI001958D5D9|nr:deoxyribose-phosphate aldolase [Gemmiger formicilis]